MQELPVLSRHLSLTTLQLFVAVCETGSIGHAAEREFIAASAVSKRLSDLEAEVGVPLLERHSRGVKPTAAGESLLHHARAILFDVQRLQADLQEFAEGMRGHVRVFANLSSIVQFLPEELGHFALAHPGIKIDLQECMSTQALAAVQEGAAELGICHTPGGPPALLQAKPYHQDRLVLVVPESHPLVMHAAHNSDSNNEPQKPFGIDFSSTLDYEYVGLQRASSIGLLMRQAAAAAGKTVRQRIQVHGLDTMCRMIDNGLGIGIMPHRAFALMQPMGHLKALTLNDHWALRQSWIVARDFAALSSSARLLVSHLETAVTTNQASAPILSQPFESALRQPQAAT